MIPFKRIGKLTQAAEELPFPVKRIYWINTKGQSRGGHAHKETHQVITCMQGSFTLVIDDGREITRHYLTAENPIGIRVDWEWHTMEDCSEDCIILVFASTYYNECDYIRDYNKWKGMLNDSADTTTV